MLGIVVLLTVIALLQLGFILLYVMIRALPALNLEFFTQTPESLGGDGGGMLNAIVGTLLIVATAFLMAVPVSLLTGIYLNEQGSSRFANTVRLLTNTMAGVPSIAGRLFAYTLVVLVMGGFSAFSGGVALVNLMMPVMVRAT
jgi:phosphate transport system permease protein